MKTEKTNKTKKDSITSEKEKQHEYAQHMRVDAAKSLEDQQAYLKKMKDAKKEFDLVMTDAFVRGIRDIGYKSTGTAHNELMDNAIQAGASRIDVLLHHEGERNKRTQPEAIAVVDNGHGMEPDMIRAAMRWGGTHRENNRNGMGRYGFGLKSSCVSFALRFTVYSKQNGGDWHAVELDVEEVARGHYTTDYGMVLVPKAEKKAPPSWIDPKLVKGLSSGTIIVIDKIESDRLTKKTIHSLKEHLLENFGLVYRNYIGTTDIWVDGTETQGLDPLFLRSDCRLYDENKWKAEALPPMSLPVKSKDKKEVRGHINVRFSAMPPQFFRKDENKDVSNNQRFKIRSENNGLIICRAGRQLDVTTRVEKDSNKTKMTFSTDMRYCGIEIDFTPSLDELFSVTTSKQQIVLSEEVWQMLRSNGFDTAVASMRSRFKEMRTELRATGGSDDGGEETARPSEAVMGEVEGYVTPLPGAETTAAVEEAQEKFEAAAKDKAKKTTMPVEEVKKALVAEAEGRPWKVVLEEVSGGNFYRFDVIGAQKVLYINQKHPFFSEVYASSDTSPRLRNALDVLLFTLGHCESTASPKTKYVYDTEKVRWSTELSHALQRLAEWREINNDDDLDDFQAVDEPEAAASA